ncbi:hypothetical protein EW146_g5790 [Bondarzewia mesenterica]|uniref:DUF4203 domain-containing protein n=1 Tax=Bondarzewia mesenterica TaxID=1095465 RepID=A0A4V3XEQ3_9AGAM|nr:hypothetical protein EW146_g5790 [Bondarzewia mesenterica]
MTNSTVTLTDLLPSTSYTLAYTLPLLFVSFILTFAGAFVTLDRTRYFSPRDDTSQMPAAVESKRRKRPHLYLEAGIGGLAIGYAFGLKLSTFLSLLIPNESSTSPLTSKSFLAVWLLSTLPTMILAGRFKYVALTFAGITGGSSLALALSVTLHPSLLIRRIFICLLTPMLTIITVLPFDRTQHASLRMAACSSGAFGLTISTALLAKVPAWGNVWERLWISDGSDWSTAAEHGLSAEFWLIFILGCMTDWALQRVYGGNPDQKWDSYLAEYTSSLPNASDRAGTFRPITSTFWDRLFRPFRRSSSRPLFPPSDEVKFPLSPSAPHARMPLALETRGFSLEKTLPESSFMYDKRPGMLCKPSDRPLARLMALGSTQGGAQRKREAVKFHPLAGTIRDTDWESDDDSDTKIDEILSTPPPKRRVSSRSSLSQTLTNASSSHETTKDKNLIFDIDEEKARLASVKRTFVQPAARGDGAPEYSDYEEDVTALATRPSRDAAGWSPPFLHRHDFNPTPPKGAEIPPGAVPMTPSLLYALDRVAVAQRDAFGPQGSSAPTSGLPPLGVEDDKSKSKHWDSFWQDVKEKASEGVRR